MDLLDYILDAYRRGSNLVAPNQEDMKLRQLVAPTMFGSMPVIGDLLSGIDMVDSARKGEYGEAALNGVGLLPFVPALGGITKSEIEKIVSAAFKELKTGRTHSTGNIHLRNELPDDWDVYNDVSGFLTNKGRFLDREDAAKFVGLKSNDRLTSENLGSGSEKYRPKEIINLDLSR